MERARAIRGRISPATTGAQDTPEPKETPEATDDNGGSNDGASQTPEPAETPDAADNGGDGGESDG